MRQQCKVVEPAGSSFSLVLCTDHRVSIVGNSKSSQIPSISEQFKAILLHQPNKFLCANPRSLLASFRQKQDIKNRLILIQNARQTLKKVPQDDAGIPARLWFPRTLPGPPRLKFHSHVPFFPYAASEVSRQYFAWPKQPICHEVQPGEDHGRPRKSRQTSAI